MEGEAAPHPCETHMSFAMASCSNFCLNIHIYIYTCSYMSTIRAHVCTFLIDAKHLNRRSNIYFDELESGLGFQASGLLEEVHE